MKTKADALQSSINWCVVRSEKLPASAAVEVVEDKKGVWLPVHHPGSGLPEQHQKLRGLHILQNHAVISSISGVVQSYLDTTMVKVNLYAAPAVSLLMVVLH